MAYDIDTKEFTGTPAIAISCWCSIEFAIPRKLYDYYDRMDGAFSLHCPLGHKFIPSKSSAQKLRDEIVREKSRADQALADAAWWRDRTEQANTRATVAERQAAARKGQVTKIKNRIKNGVCPFCTRTFENVARHMATCHPHETQESGDGAAV